MSPVAHLVCHDYIPCAILRIDNAHKNIQNTNKANSIAFLGGYSALYKSQAQYTEDKLIHNISQISLTVSEQRTKGVPGLPLHPREDNIIHLFFS